MNVLSLSVRDARREPFPYALLSSVFSEDAAAAILRWLERERRWFLAETEFYEQYELSLLDVTPPAEVGFLADGMLRPQLRLEMERLFGVALAPEVGAVAHKLTPGQHIGIHNDMLDGGETHRLTVLFNRGHSERDGGYFMLFNSADARHVHRVLRPIHNTALAFAISEHSHHAVSTQHEGTRYSLVFSFHEHGR